MQIRVSVPQVKRDVADAVAADKVLPISCRDMSCSRDLQILRVVVELLCRCCSFCSTMPTSA